MSLTDVLVGALIGGCAVIAGGVIVAKYKWRKQIDFVCIKEVYEPLHKKIIEYHNFIMNLVEPVNFETFVRGIKDNYWYPRVSKNVSVKFQEWQSRASEYNTMRKDMIEKIKNAINQEIGKRETALEPSPDKDRLVLEFNEITTEGFLRSGSIAPSLLIQRGKIDEEEYYFIDNFKRGGGPSEREIRVKLASGFPKAIYEEIRKFPLFNSLLDKVTEVEGAAARLRDVLEKRVKK